MTPELRVNPVRLQAVAAQQSEIASFMSEMAVGTSMAAASAAMPGLDSGQACELAGSVVDQFHRAIADELSEHAAKLGTAADRYTDTDAELGRRLATFVT